MKKFSKKLAVLVLVLCMVFGTLVPVSAATRTSKADKQLQTAVTKVMKNRKITSSTSKTVALNRVFTYVSKLKYGRAPLGFKPATTKKWEINFAMQMLKSRSGSCYHYAAALAFCAKKATGYPVRIGFGTSNFIKKTNWQPHAWVEVKIGRTWYVYDANAAAVASKQKINGTKWSKVKLSTVKNKKYKPTNYINVEI